MGPGDPCVNAAHGVHGPWSHGALGPWALVLRKQYTQKPNVFVAENQLGEKNARASKQKTSAVKKLHLSVSGRGLNTLSLSLYGQA